jgi:hypothetical protein
VRDRSAHQENGALGGLNTRKWAILVASINRCRIAKVLHCSVAVTPRAEICRRACKQPVLLMADVHQAVRIDTRVGSASHRNATHSAEMLIRLERIIAEDRRLLTQMFEPPIGVLRSEIACEAFRAIRLADGPAFAKPIFQRAPARAVRLSENDESSREATWNPRVATLAKYPPIDNRAAKDLRDQACVDEIQ